MIISSIFIVLHFVLEAFTLLKHLCLCISLFPSAWGSASSIWAKCLPHVCLWVNCLMDSGPDQSKFATYGPDLHVRILYTAKLLRGKTFAVTRQNLHSLEKLRVWPFSHKSHHWHKNIWLENIRGWLKNCENRESFSPRMICHIWYSLLCFHKLQEQSLGTVGITSCKSTNKSNIICEICKNTVVWKLQCIR